MITTVLKQLITAYSKRRLPKVEAEIRLSGLKEEVRIVLES